MYLNFSNRRNTKQEAGCSETAIKIWARFVKSNAVCIRNYRIVFLIFLDNLLKNMLIIAYFLCLIGSFSFYVHSHYSCWWPGRESSGRRQDYHLWPWLEPEHWYPSTRTSLEDRSEETRDHLSSNYKWNNRGEDLPSVRNVMLLSQLTSFMKLWWQKTCYGTKRFSVSCHETKTQVGRSGQSKQKQVTHWTNQNTERQHATGAKRRKTRESSDAIGFWSTPDWLKCLLVV